MGQSFVRKPFFRYQLLPPAGNRSQPGLHGKLPNLTPSPTKTRNLCSASFDCSQTLNSPHESRFVNPPPMTIAPWKAQFKAVHASGISAWLAGNRSPSHMFNAHEQEFLASIGCSTQELFDFIDDLQDYGEPDFETVFAVQEIRFNYFKDVMHSQPSGIIASMADLPAKTDAVQGISWLPRLIVKARLKLKGEMPLELMYGCGGDRPFLRRMHMTLASFLQLVWDCGDDDTSIIEAVKKSAATSNH